MNFEQIKKRFAEGRKREWLEVNDQPSKSSISAEDFSIVETLKGTWVSPEQGWNLIALPFKDSSAQFNYRVLMNQYSESLKFKFADKNIPNRGITPDAHGESDQLIDALDYEQAVKQVFAEDSPVSSLKSENKKGIHHEAGLFLQILNHEAKEGEDNLNIARLATIPHGDSVLAMGKVEVIDGPPIIPDLNALPLRVNQDVLNNPYLEPYKHFEDNHFFGTVPLTVPGFPGFFPTNANAIIQFANPGEQVKRTTILHFDTVFKTGGIVNIPFVVREANATDMTATFWIMELEREDESLPAQFIMQYTQTVFLDFFESPDNSGELIRWPHVSINTLRRA